MQKLLIVFAFAIAIMLVLTIPSLLGAKAASMADVQVQSGATENNTAVGAIAAAGSGNEAAKMLLTILPDKPIVKPGSAIGYTITAQTENGTAIPDANLSSIIVDYGTGKNKMLMSGETNDKGEFRITTQTGPNTHPGQLLITAVGSHSGFTDAKASTGVIVGSGSSTASSSSSSGKCSGSSCK